MTNTELSDRIIGMNVENTVINEGTNRFDIVYFVRMKENRSKIIVNIQAQKDNP